MLMQAYFRASSSNVFFFASLLLGTGLFALTGCGPSEEEVRDELREMGIGYNEASFIRAASANRDSVVRLFV
jgi:hypothetical protein